MTIELVVILHGGRQYLDHTRDLNEYIDSARVAWVRAQMKGSEPEWSNPQMLS